MQELHTAYNDPPARPQHVSRLSPDMRVLCVLINKAAVALGRDDTSTDWEVHCQEELETPPPPGYVFDIMVVRQFFEADI